MREGEAMTNPAVLRCLEKAAECERRAQEATEDHARQVLRRMAENWRFLSENHRRIAVMDAKLAARADAT
jgi:hypothetical protein